MSYLRDKKIGNNYYTYEQESYREGKKVRTRHIRYVGRASGSSVSSSGRVGTTNTASEPEHTRPIGTTKRASVPEHKRPIGTTKKKQIDFYGDVLNKQAKRTEEVHRKHIVTYTPYKNDKKEHKFTIYVEGKDRTTNTYPTRFKSKSKALGTAKRLKVNKGDTISVVEKKEGKLTDVYTRKE
jgi:hypothetical protein